MFVVASVLHSIVRRMILRDLIILLILLCVMILQKTFGD